jgi:HAD superfamily hydrolase (TIGR01509 family)
LDASGLAKEFDRIVHERPPRVAPGARAALRDVRELGCRVGIVSNVVFETAAGARRVLDRLHLSTLCDAIVLSADDGVAKPDPRPFLRCLRQLGVAPSAAWYVGDMPTDVTGARAAGLRPIHFVGLRRFGPGSSSWVSQAPSASVLRDWSDLPGLLFGSGRVD